MSLTPKVVEVPHVVQDAKLEFICTIKSWLKPHIQDFFVEIDGYHLVRRAREEIMHGGVFTFIKDTIPFSIVEDLADKSLEVLWLDIRPYRLPRGVNNIIVGVIYLPPLASNSEMLVYLINCPLSNRAIPTVGLFCSV